MTIKHLRNVVLASRNVGSGAQPLSHAELLALVEIAEVARLYVSMRKATVETEADSGLLPQSLYDLEANQLAALDKVISDLEGVALKAG